MTKLERAELAELGKTPEELQMQLAAMFQRVVTQQEREIEKLRAKNRDREVENYL